MTAPARGDHERGISAPSKELIGELDAAEMVLISTPMHNTALPPPGKPGAIM
jgi:FMN-dependent NADH-azoreductase